MSDSLTQLATTVHDTADLLCVRSVEPDVLDQARALIEQANQLLSSGRERTEEDRLVEFASQMVVPMGATIIEDGEQFEAFTASPYSGKHNAMRPTQVAYRRVGDEVHADVLVGAALEGAPGRAHGGLTAAIFDDIMGAMQRVTALSGYTRTLSIEYLAKLPIDEVVQFQTQLVDQTEKTFTLEAQALHNGTQVATAVGVFTLLSFEQFIPSESA